MSSHGPRGPIVRIRLTCAELLYCRIDKWDSGLANLVDQLDPGHNSL